MALYRQKRTNVSGLTGISQPTVGQGFEYEFRYVATNNLSFTFTGDLQHTEVIGPDHSVVYLPVSAVGVPGIQGYGGAYLTFDFASLPGRSGNYAYTLIPNTVASLFATYTSNTYDWGQAGATMGVTYASQTSGLVQNAVVYPDYEVVNASLYYRRGSWEATLNIDNLLDKLYFTPDQDTYANVGVLPSKGREWRVTLKKSF